MAFPDRVTAEFIAHERLQQRLADRLDGCVGQHHLDRAAGRHRRGVGRLQLERARTRPLPEPLGGIVAPSLRGLVAYAAEAEPATGIRPTAAANAQYGPLRPAGPELALPEGFQYLKLGVEGTLMSDGEATPPAHDGMAAPAQKAAATQAAIWHYTDEYQLTDDGTNDQVIVDNYNAILAAVEDGLEGFGEPTVSLSITPPESTSGEAGGQVGPYVVNTSADEVTLTPSEGVTLHNEDGSPFGQNPGY